MLVYQRVNQQKIQIYPAKIGIEPQNIWWFTHIKNRKIRIKDVIQPAEYGSWQVRHKPVPPVRNRKVGLW